MRRLAIFMTGALAMGLAPGNDRAAADEARFELRQADGAIVRLDRQTGAITTCRERDGELTCHMAPDERAAYESELDLLEKRVTALEERLSQIRPDRLPNDAEVDRSLSIMERFMRSFMGLVREFTGEPEPKRDSGPQPDRT